MASFSFENTKSTAALVLDLLPTLVLAITFLQSGIDKLVDRAGNESYFRSHFAKSPLAKFSGPMLSALMVVELLAGVLSALGFLQILLGGGRTLAFWGATISAFTFAGLFAGQRIAKDYVGAANLIPYFLVALFGIFTLQ
ncbi:MAG: DoxX family protein [Myxococcota bacterium]|nr:DoxX family protein [Myxococcota bacterium]